MVRFIFVLLTALMAVYPANAAYFLNVEGRLTDSTGTVPVEASSVDFTLEIYDAGGSCLLYSETHSAVNMSTSLGYFSLSLGNGTVVSDPNSAGATGVFNNSSALNCQGGGTTGPIANAPRLLKVSYNDGSGLQVLQQNIEIGASAYAIESENAQKVGGIAASSLLQSNAGQNLNQTNLESLFAGGNFAELTALLAGTSSNYLQNPMAASLNMNGNGLTNLVDPSAAQDAATKNYVDTQLTNKSNWDTAFSWGDHSSAGYLTSFSETDPTIVALTAGKLCNSDGTTVSCSVNDNSSNWDSAFSWGDHSAAGYLSSPMTAAFNMNNYAIQNLLDPTSAQDAATKNYVDSSLSTFLPLTGGTLTGALNSSAVISTSATVSTNGISVGSANSLVLYDSTNTNSASLKAPASLAGSVVWTLPTADGTSGQVLQTDGSGNLSFANPGSAPVSSVFGRTGAVVATSGDYSASQIVNTPSGNISSTDVQAALNELDGFIINALKIDGSLPMSGALQLPDGTSTSPALTFSSDVSTGLFNGGTSVGVSVSGSEVARFDSSGYLGIGTFAPAAKLDVYGSLKVGSDSLVCNAGTGGAIEYSSNQLMYCDGSAWQVLANQVSVGDLRSDGSIPMSAALSLAGTGVASSPDLTFVSDSNTGLYSPSADVLAIAAGGADEFVVSPGQAFLPSTAASFGIGTGAPSAALDVHRDGADSALNLHSYNGVPRVVGYQSAGTQASPSATMGSSDILYIGAKGYDGTAHTQGAAIRMTASENWSTGMNGTEMSFSVTSNGATGITEAMHIANDGRIGIGTSFPNSNLEVNGSARFASMSPPAEGGSCAGETGALLNDSSNELMQCISGTWHKIRQPIQPAIVGSLSVYDYAQTKMASLTGDCGATINLHNMKDGGEYNFWVQGTGGGATCNFNFYSDAGVSSLAAQFPSTGNSATTASQTRLYKFMVFGSTVLVTFEDN